MIRLVAVVLLATLAPREIDCRQGKGPIAPDANVVATVVAEAAQPSALLQMETERDELVKVDATHSTAIPQVHLDAMREVRIRAS